MNIIPLIIITVINAIVFSIYGIDKYKAKQNLWRIPEAVLLFLAVFGPIGALIGMKVWHHKTRKPKFYITVPVILVLEIVILIVGARFLLGG